MKKYVKSWRETSKVTHRDIENLIVTLNGYLYKLKQEGFISEEFEDDDVDYVVRRARNTLDIADSVASCCKRIIKDGENFKNMS